MLTHELLAKPQYITSIPLSPGLNHPGGVSRVGLLPPGSSKTAAEALIHIDSAQVREASAYQMQWDKQSMDFTVMIWQGLLASIPLPHCVPRTAHAYFCLPRPWLPQRP